MTDGNRDIHLGEEENNKVVGLDKNHPVLQRADQLMIRAILKERLAILAETQALASRESGEESSSSGLWGEMPRLAREHEGSLEDGDLPGDGPPQAEDSEFDEYGGVPSG